MTTAVAPKLGTRAVVRMVEPGLLAICARCETPVRFRAQKKLRQVIANVYVKKRWNRVEQFHEDCYLSAGEPYGEADMSKVGRG